MRKNLLSTCLLGSLLLAGTVVSAQSLEKMLKKTSKEDKAASKSTKATPKKARMAAEATLTLPLLETNYYFDSESETWIVSGYNTNEYDANGNLIMKAYFQEFEGDTIYKNTYEYDTKGNQIGSYDYSKDWNSNTLILRNGNRSTYSYDSNGRLTEDVYSNYDTDNSIWKDVEKTVYGYTGSADAPSSITRYEWNGTEWVELAAYVNITWYNFADFEVKSYSSEYIDEDDGETYRETFTSTSPVVSVELVEKKVENDWVPAERYTNSIDAQDNNISTYEVYINNEWVALEKTTRSEDAQGKTTFLYQEYINSIWVNIHKEIEFVDAFGNYAGYELYEWLEDAWVLEYSSVYQNIYDEDGVLVEKITSNSKTVYSDFETFTITSTSNAIATIELKAFPNPVSDVLHITTPNQESAEVRVYTMQNALMQSASLEAGNAAINVSNLAAGVYMLQVQTASGIQLTERIVKK